MIDCVSCSWLRLRISSTSDMVAFELPSLGFDGVCPSTHGRLAPGVPISDPDDGEDDIVR